MKNIRNKRIELSPFSNPWIWSSFFALIFTVLLLQGELALLLLIASLAGVLILINNISYFTYVLILLIPLSVNLEVFNGFRLSMPSEGLLIAFAGIVILKMLVDQKIKFPLSHPISIVILIDLGWSLLTSFSSEAPLISFKRLIIKTLFVLVYFYFVPGILQKGTKYKALFLLYGFGILFPILYATYTHYLLGLSQKNSIQTSLPFYDEHTIYGACIAFILPFFTMWAFNAKKYRAEFFLFLILLVMGLMFSYSRAAWLSLGISIFIYLLIKLKVSSRVIFAMSIGLFTLLAFNFSSIYQKLENTNTKYGDEVSSHLASVTNLKNDASNLERINRWVSSVKLFQDRPLTGYGPGTYQFVYDKFQTTEYMTRISTNIGDRGNAHSEYLTLLAETGIIGLLLFLLLIGSSYYYAIKIILYTPKTQTKYIVFACILGLTTFYVHGLFNSFIDSNKMAVLVYGSLGLITLLHQESQKINAPATSSPQD